MYKYVKREERKSNRINLYTKESRKIDIVIKGRFTTQKFDPGYSRLFHRWSLLV